MPNSDAIRVVPGMTADDVALQRVICPGCSNKVFEQWPLGWDAHSAYRCTMSGTTPVERKAEYRRQFRRLFRDDGVTGKQ